MKKLTTALLGLLILFSSSCRLIKPSKDMGYDFVATLFNGKVEADGMRYLIKNLDGTIYNSNVVLVDGGPSVDSALGEKIFVFYWANEAYGFFCKKPQKGKPLQILVGDEWKLLNHTQSVRVDSTVKFFQRYMYSPKIRGRNRVWSTSTSSHEKTHHSSLRYDKIALRSSTSSYARSVVNG